MNKKLFYFFSLLCFLSFRSAWGMKKVSKWNKLDDREWKVIFDYLDLTELVRRLGFVSKRWFCCY